MSHEGNDAILESYWEMYYHIYIEAGYSHNVASLLANKYARKKFDNGPHGDHENDWTFRSRTRTNYRRLFIS